MSAQNIDSNQNKLKKSTLVQTLALFASTTAAYFWLQVPTLAQYSLQAFAACILLYIILKKLNDAAIWQVLPTTNLDEMVLASFAFLMLIGATGGTTSIFFFLIFIYLFFVSITMKRWTAIATTLTTCLFFYAITPNVYSNLHVSHIASIPVVMVFFLFARYQLEQSRQQQTLIEIEKNQVTNYQIYLQHKESQLDEAKKHTWNWRYFYESFIFEFLQPKLDQLIDAASWQQNIDVIKGQLTLMRMELEKLKVKMHEQDEKTKP